MRSFSLAPGYKAAVGIVTARCIEAADTAVSAADRYNSDIPADYTVDSAADTDYIAAGTAVHRCFDIPAAGTGADRCPDIPAAGTAAVRCPDVPAAGTAAGRCPDVPAVGTAAGRHSDVPVTGCHYFPGPCHTADYYPDLDYLYPPSLHPHL